MENIRPCFKSSDPSVNCGRCTKCIGTALAFAAEGIAPPNALNVGPLLPAVNQLAKLKWTAAETRRIKDAIISPALRNGIDAPWLDQLNLVFQQKKRKIALRQLATLLFSFIRRTKKR
jgi:hypothetical protein